MCDGKRSYQFEVKGKKNGKDKTKEQPVDHNGRESKEKIE